MFFDTGNIEWCSRPILLLFYGLGLSYQWRTQNFSMGGSVTSHRDDVSFSDITAIIMP